jgi:hypothetical protein
MGSALALAVVLLAQVFLAVSTLGGTLDTDSK